MKLVFVCGALRSGTSMSHLMLNAHPEIRNPGEFDFFFDLHARVGREPSAGEFAESLQQDRIFLSKNLKLDSTVLDYEGLLRSFVSQMTGNSKALCLNIHRNFELAYKYFPEALFVHLIRDPRDVSRSSIGMGWAGNVYFGVDHWIATEQSWQILSSLIPPEKVHELRFENLVTNPEKCLQALCKFLTLAYSNEMLEYDQASTYSKPDSSLVNQWKTKLKPREIELIEQKTLELMKARGYSTIHPKPRAPKTPELLTLKAANFLYRQKFALDRYGAWLYIALKTSEKLPLKSLRKFLLIKKNRVDQQHLK